MAIRLRKENGTWIQTLKANGKNPLSRYENEFECKNNVPQLNLHAYKKDKTAKTLLLKALHSQDELLLQFETIFNRESVHVKHQNSVIEICFDQGKVQTTEHHSSINEIEFELKQGSVHDLITYIQPWIQKYHLWIDMRSKAERGNLLFQQQKVSPAQPLKGFTYDKKTHFLQQNFQTSLHHFLMHSNTLADQIADISHIKQLELSLELVIHQAHIYFPCTDLTPLNHILTKIQALHCFHNTQHSNFSRIMNRLNKQLSQEVCHPQTTQILLELLKLSLNDTLFDLANIKLKIDADHFSNTYVSLQHYSLQHHPSKKMQKLQFSLKQYFGYQNLIKATTEFSLLATDRAFLNGWLNAKLDSTQQTIQKLIHKI